MVGAFVAGIFMFLAPCTLPLVPGYLAFIGGNKVMRNAVTFVLGFGVVFVLLGLFAGSLGSIIGPYRFWGERLAGILIIFFGLTMLGVGSGLLQREWHARVPKFIQRGNPASSFLIGALFALGWSPCIGPILGTVLLLASSSSTASTGALLLALFALGLGLPFLLTALLLKQVSEAFLRMAKVAVYAQYIGGALLVVVGAGLLAGSFAQFTDWALLHIPGYTSLLNYL